MPALFASASLARLLALLMRDPQRRFHQRELERLTGGHLRQLQRDLDRLERSGLVARSPSGNRVYYAAVPCHPAFDDLRRALIADGEPVDAIAAPADEPDAVEPATAERGRDTGSVAVVKGLPGHLTIDRSGVRRLCRRWKITELSLFGSVLRDDFDSASDVDLLVTFAPDARWTLFDHSDMQADFGTLFGRKVDVVNREVLEQSDNWIRRRAILEGARLLYAA